MLQEIEYVQDMSETADIWQRGLFVFDLFSSAFPQTGVNSEFKGQKGM